MQIQELQENIRAVCKARDAAILAHSYQSEDVTSTADLVGDSFALSKKASTLPQKTVVVCGVRFMAETVKLLNPDKTVILASPDAGCPMADQMTAEMLLAERKKYPNAAAVAYINTTTSLKTVCDVCVTSASAAEIVKKLPEKEILFVPDCHLGQYVASLCPDKIFHFVEGGCPIHTSVTVNDVKNAKEKHPRALLLVHPECLPEVTAMADYAGSTSGIMAFAEKSEAKEFIIGTELSIVEHLSFKCPDKAFYPLSKKLICADMKLTTLCDVYRAVSGTGGEEIILSPDVAGKAKKCIDRMIALG